MYRYRPISAYSIRTTYRAYLYIYRPTQAYNKHTTHRANLHTYTGLHKPKINLRHIGLTYIHTYRLTPVYINAHIIIIIIKIFLLKGEGEPLTGH